MSRVHTTSTTLLIAALSAGAATLLAAEPGQIPAETVAKDQKLPQTLTVTCSLDAYGFTPIQKSWHIDQHSYGLKTHELVLKRHDRRTPWTGSIPGWKGRKTIDVKGGYTVRIDAHYLIRQLRGDFVHKPSGLTLDVAYFYNEKLIAHGTAAQWSEEEKIALSVPLADTAYVALMNEKGFGIPSQFAGYDNGFRYWAAVRDGLNAREGTNFESLSAVLKPLGRDGNLMMPTVTVHAKVTRPTGSDIPAANAETLNIRRGPMPAR